MDENVAKLGKEKKGLEDNLQERTEQLQAAEDKCSSLNKAKNKVESQLKDVSTFSLSPIDRFPFSNIRPS